LRDLVALLQDRNAEVRQSAAGALRHLSGNAEISERIDTLDRERNAISNNQPIALRSGFFSRFFCGSICLPNRSSIADVVGPRG
jgi:hypothetical protein